MHSNKAAIIWSDVTDPRTLEIDTERLASNLAERARCAGLGPQYQGAYRWYCEAAHPSIEAAVVAAAEPLCSDEAVALFLVVGDSALLLGMALQLLDRKDRVGGFNTELERLTGFSFLDTLGTADPDAKAVRKPVAALVLGLTLVWGTPSSAISAEIVKKEVAVASAPMRK